ncbi:Na+/H+ antiporter [Tunturiibacter gelidoferens]|uniref:CPA1 family monovalent cation:H+ antiporter n=2 Tax=Tunturiibacter TaxID=3154218 RepID=A0A7Y9T409_9BACT|nr:Na+/H+ antiporter [Edaphobacter lichenicola]NYF52931.1 CPA1 family monovalent cation:H+ antiporter [Edaphobacter lichenicola]
MEAGSSLHAVETVILLLLVLVAGFAAMARRIKVPYPIVLVLAGLIISFLPRMPRVPLDPNVVFVVFLPPLLYASAWWMSWREFRRNAILISLMAFGLVGFTVWGVAEFSEHFITALDWKAGFLLGAVVATTDAIAATSIAKSIGLPRRIVDILEGESLLNDATGLLALEIGLGIIQGGETPTLGGGLARLLYLVIGGIGIGLLIGVIVGWLEKFIDYGPVELVVSLVVPYAAYIAGEHAKASGVLAVVACGIYLSRKSTQFFSPEVRLQVHGAWDALTFMLNGLVFVLIGLQLPYVLNGIHGKFGRGTLIFYGAVFSVVLIVLRMVWVFPAIKIASYVERRWMGHQEEELRPREVFVVGWTGMRGVIALAAAFSVPEMLGNGRAETRNLIVFLAFCVILVTLVLQGLTLPALIRALGLAGVPGMDPEEKEARRIVLRAALHHLEEERKRQGQDAEHLYDDLIHRYRHKLAAVGGGEEGDLEAADTETMTRLRSILEDALQAERRTLISLRDRGRISDDTLRTMERELDLAETRYQGTPIA